MADFPRIPFDEAIEALRRRGTNLFPSDHWATVWQSSTTPDLPLPAPPGSTS